MKKILLIFLFIISCKSDKEIKPMLCVERIGYYESSKQKMTQPSILIDIKVEDSIVTKKLEEGRLRGFIIYSIQKEDRNRFFYNAEKLPIKKGNNFSFVLWTSYFGSSVSDVESNKKRKWESDDIVKALSGDIGLVFDKDTVRVKNCTDKNTIIEINN